MLLRPRSQQMKAIAGCNASLPYYVHGCNDEEKYTEMRYALH